MAERYFIDTSFLIAQLNPRDSDHSHAKRLTKTVQQAALVTSESVLTELLNAFSGRGAHLRKIAVQSVRHLQAHPAVTVVSIDSDLFGLALGKYQAYSDKAWGLTDCLSFVIMEQQGITAALTADKHFEQAGFAALLR